MPRLVEDIFLPGTQHGVYICTLPNVRGTKPGERHVLTRDPERIAAFVKKWDQPGRGLFYCVSTIKTPGPRDKDHYGETTLLHADVDFKAIACSPDEALEALLNLPVPPSRIHKTGNGLHALWRLADPCQEIERVERVLKRIREVVGGDKAVAHAAALMRWPASHNTKNDAWTEVAVVRDEDQSWPIQELEAVFTSLSPVILYKDALPENPFTRAASVLEFKPPVDVDAALASMADGNVHNTQLSVTAALMSAGGKVDEVADRVLEATRRVGTDAWNWDQELETIRGMCEDWVRKHPVEERRPPRRKAAGQDFRDEGPDVVSLTEKRNEKSSEKTGKARAHVVLGTGVLQSLRDTGRQLTVTKTGPWLCTNGLWSELMPDAWRGWVSREVELGCRALKLVSTQKLVSETSAWLLRNPDIYVASVPWDDHQKIATRSGLVDWRTLNVEPLLPEHNATHRVECAYDLDAGCPHWEQMLMDMGFDEATRTVLQEVLGAALVDKKPRGMMRALVLVGGSNSGKSNVLKVMARLLSDNPIATPLDTLENAHGLQDFLRRAPWLLDEAFDQSKWHVSSAVKALLSGDHVGINVKNGPLVTHSWRSAAFWGTNTPPQFKEASRAIENRIIIVNCTAQFDPGRPTGVAREALRLGHSSPADLVLAEERSGVLNWAIAGLRRAWARGHLVLTEDMQIDLGIMRRESNMADGFFSDCVLYDPDCMVSQPDLYGAFFAWWAESTDKQVPSPKSLGRSIAALPGGLVAVDNNDLRWNRIRYYGGIRLNDLGLDHWAIHSNLTGQRGDVSRISNAAAEVNHVIPVEWNEKAAIKRMRLRQRAIAVGLREE